MKNLLVRFVREEEGQDLIEYSLLCALIAVACIAAMQALATDINGIFGAIGSALFKAPSPVVVSRGDTPGRSRRVAGS